MNPAIRLAVPADRSAVEQIVQEAYAPYVPRIGRKPAPMLDDYAGLIRDQRVHVLEDDPRAIGVLVLIPQGDAMLLDNIAVRPDAHGLGYGRRLLAFAERTAREAGYRQIRLYTNEMMTENIALYSRIGFTETHRAEEKGLRRVYMIKVLR
jgi:ribosomal protein S18 acetylase RimI-like enzyme